MEGVIHISSELVQAATHHEAENQRVQLSPWDLQYLLVGPIQKGLLFSKPQQPDQNTTFIHHLKTSLSHTLVYFAPVAGRLATTDHENDTVSFYVDCNNAGALFIHAKAGGVTISDIVKPDYEPSIVHSFFPLDGLKNYEGFFNPLLGVQVTELVDGVFIGCTINHSVADGSSFWHFFNSWSAISRGSVQLPILPVSQRSFLGPSIEFPIRIPRSHVQDFHDDFIVPPLKERIFHFSKHSIAQLKAKANTELGTGTNQISSLQALLSHLWRSVIRNKNLDPNEDTHFYLVIGARQRLHDLPEQYFGNAGQTQNVTVKVKELLEQGVGNIALKMNKLIAAITEHDLKKVLESWIASPKLLKMSTFTSKALIISSSPRFNMYGNDFGWGKPIAVRCGSANKFDGKITVYTGAEEGSIDIEACLSPETLNALANYQEFMDAITN